MKKLLLFIAMTIVSLSVWAQSSPFISYQAVVRDANNRLVTNEAITVTIQVLDASDNVQYNETDDVTSNANGLISLIIGDNNPTEFAAINWEGAKFKTTVHVNSSGYEVVSTTPVTAAPLALHAIYASDVNPAGSTVQAIYNKIQGDSLTLANRIQNDSLILANRIKSDSTALHNALIDTANNIRNSIGDGTLSITYGTNTPVTFTANQHTNSSITIPEPTSANDATITIKKNGVEVNHFTLNQSTDQDIDIIVPTKVTDLEDNANYVTKTILNDTLNQYYTKTETYTQAEVNALLSTTDAGVNTLRDSVKTNITNIANLQDRVNTFNTHVCDSVMACDGIQTMQNNISTNASNIATNASAITGLQTKAHNDSLTLANKIQNDSLTLVNRIKSDSTVLHNALIDTAANIRGALVDSANAIRNSIGNGTLTITYGTETPVTFTANQNTNSSIAIPAPTSANDAEITITSSTATITNGSFTLNQSGNQNIGIEVPTKLSEMVNDGGHYAKRDSVNVFTEANDFTNKITVPSKFDIHNPTPCTQDAVNICDLIAVFDSLNRKIDKLTERINQLEAANCPILGTVNVSDTTFGSATLSATIGNYDPLTVKQFGFLISTVPINGYESAIAHSVATQSAGVFTMNIAGLQPNTTYYVKPYVLNDTVRCTQDTMVGMQNTWTTDEFVVTLSETSICLGESVTVSATSTTIPNIGTVSYTWSTGADVPSITATPDKIGDTTFTVSATYGGYTATASATVTVKPMPDAAITSDPDPAYYEGSIPVQLTAAETAAGATFAWDTVPANALLMSTDRSIYVQPEAPTDYKVVVTLDGCVSESTITVMTRQCPTLTMVTTTEGSTIPTRTTFSSAITNFTGTIQDLGFLLTLDESWTGVVDTLRLTGVSFPLNVGPTDFPFSKDTVLTSGLLYHVRAFATTDPSICPVGYVDGEAVPYKVEAPSPISLTGNDSICGGEEITLTAPDGYNSYSWSNGKNTQSITVKPYGTTVYTVTADGTAFSRAVTVLQPVTIYGNPGNNANELVFDVRKVPGAHYEWKLGNNVIPNSDTNVVTVSADVTGSPKCYVTVTLGHCSVSDSAKVATVVNARDLCGITTVTDHEGNRYNVVAFENTYNFIDNAHNNDLLQCWTKENMRAVTSPSTGTYLVREVGRDEPVSWTGKIAAWPANDSLHYAPMNYGVLYNWNAALDLYHRGYGELSVNSGAIRIFNFLQDFPRGICPLGWHVARSSEWTAVEAPLANRTFDQLEAISGPRSVNYLGNKMASGIWSSSVSSCRTGDNNCSYRNVSDLSVLPAGTNNDVYVSSWAYFWTSESSYWYSNSTRYDTYASYLQFNGSDGGPTHSYENKQINMSARCVRDYDNSYTSAGRALYYYGYNGTSLTVGFETNPSAHVARRGVIYSTNASSALEIADSSATTLESTDGATVTEDTTNPDADKIFEKLINYSGTTYLRVFLIFDDGSVAYGQRINM